MTSVKNKAVRGDHRKNEEPDEAQAKRLQKLIYRRMRMFMLGITALFLLIGAAGWLLGRLVPAARGLWQVVFCMAVALIALGPAVYRFVGRAEMQGIRLVNIQRRLLVTIADVIEQRDNNTGGHIRRTAQLVRMLLREMADMPRYREVVTDRYIRLVESAAPLHDVGKIRIPDAILNKPGKLTDEEYETMKLHTEYGADLIWRNIRDVEEEDFFKIAYNIASFHHERYDGRGYPVGLEGERIPLEARIMALADVYDALVSPRVYKPAFPKEKAMEIIREGRGTQFDPELTDVFLRCVEREDPLED